MWQITWLVLHLTFTCLWQFLFDLLFFPLQLIQPDPQPERTCLDLGLVFGEGTTTPSVPRFFKIIFSPTDNGRSVVETGFSCFIFCFFGFLLNLLHHNFDFLFNRL